MSKSMHEKLAYRLADMLTMLNMGNVLDVGELAEKISGQSPYDYARY